MAPNAYMRCRSASRHPTSPRIVPKAKGRIARRRGENDARGDGVGARTGPASEATTREVADRGRGWASRSAAKGHRDASWGRREDSGRLTVPAGFRPRGRKAGANEAARREAVRDGPGRGEGRAGQPRRDLASGEQAYAAGGRRSGSFFSKAKEREPKSPRNLTKPKRRLVRRRAKNDQEVF